MGKNVGGREDTVCLNGFYADVIYEQALTSIRHHSMERTMEHSIKINVV